MRDNHEGTRKASVRAALFDLDGTLVDTMPIHWEAYRRVLLPLGVDLSYAHYIASIGGPAAMVIPLLLCGQSVGCSISEIHERKKAETSKLLEVRTPTALETSKLLPTFWDYLRTAVVSSGSRRGVMEILGRMGWAEQFDTVITGDDVLRGKPHPDPFLAAARELDVAPEACLVFEDTDAGIQSARAAGMQVFDVRKTTSICAQ